MNEERFELIGQPYDSVGAIVQDRSFQMLGDPFHRRWSHACKPLASELEGEYGW